MVEARTPIRIHGHWIGGQAVAAGDAVPIVNPGSRETVAFVPQGDADDVDRAVLSAREALPGWAHTAPVERAAAIARLAAELEVRGGQIAEAITAEIGVPITLSRMAQAGLPPMVASAVAGLASDVAWEEHVGNSLVIREPVGVVGAITPWNFPLQQAVTKVAPALLAGNSVVLKPAELAPLSAQFLADATDAAGIPAGVLNVVYGTGEVVGEAVAAHPDIDMVSFTGSTGVGKRVSVLASQTVKRVALELGGKSASVVLDDADIELAVAKTLESAFINSGQVCGAWTRMIVPASRYDEVIETIVRMAPGFPVGDPYDESTVVGPLASDAQWTRVNNYIEQAIAEGAMPVVGGPGRVPGFEGGAYIRPTVLADVDPDSTIAQEEIFGPVLTVMAYSDDDEAVRIANNSVYGLSGAVFGRPERAMSVARCMETGQVDINAAPFNPLAPFGGYKQSGNGREFGRLGVEEFTEVKSIQR